MSTPKLTVKAADTVKLLVPTSMEVLNRLQVLRTPSRSLIRRLALANLAPHKRHLMNKAKTRRRNRPRDQLESRAVCPSFKEPR